MEIVDRFIILPFAKECKAMFLEKAGNIVEAEPVAEHDATPKEVA